MMRRQDRDWRCGAVRNSRLLRGGRDAIHARTRASCVLGEHISPCGNFFLPIFSYSVCRITFDNFRITADNALCCKGLGGKRCFKFTKSCITIDNYYTISLVVLSSAYHYILWFLSFFGVFWEFLENWHGTCTI